MVVCKNRLRCGTTRVVGMIVSPVTKSIGGTSDNSQVILVARASIWVCSIAWAPIMGVGYYRNLTLWNNGAKTITGFPGRRKYFLEPVYLFSNDESHKF